ncbi:DUF2062 domain-containing protein [Desulforamulus aquiferis]|uniref:DUF2062 domain-containing protein n=1 Tax=Desulforamulus aquiferis TaxID=1397668 RepID=A0AAW7ZD41_9FIRM|nr:DUF2062 domain-containing protein [Desulforamulus aquiferis]MDO7787654.1 DUF2062 domain-containing protein [Desulforamulus aquiferis]RYD05978.1 hypothetical protein N752_06955 [Desulforamulus aquiferis]
MIFKQLQDTCDKLLRLKDCPYRLAKSISLGFGLAFLPLPGINIPLGIILGKILKLNIVAVTLPALLLTYISPFLYIFNYKTGARLIGHDDTPPQEYTFDYDLTFIDKVIDFFQTAGPAYLLGSAINALLISVLSYFIFLFIYNKTNKLTARIDRKKIRLNKANSRSRFPFFLGRIKNPRGLWKKIKKDTSEDNKKFPG